MGKPKTKAPPTPVPTPIYTPVSPEIAQKAEDRRRKMLAALGRRGTILAGTLGESETGLSTKLGGG